MLGQGRGSAESDMLVRGRFQCSHFSSGRDALVLVPGTESSQLIPRISTAHQGRIRRMNYRELSRIGGDPAAVRGTATLVKNLLGLRISSWQDNFLSNLQRFAGPDRLSTRQCETLVSLREQATRRKEVAGYTAFHLVRQLWELRFDLAQEDENFVVKLHKIGNELALSDAEWKYVFGLSRQTAMIDDPYIPLR